MGRREERMFQLEKENGSLNTALNKVVEENTQLMAVIKTLSDSYDRVESKLSELEEMVREKLI